MDPKELQKVVEVADKLDAEGHATEAQALDALLVKIAADEGSMSNKATNALKSLQRILKSFCGKNLDARGPKRRTMNKVCDMAEDLLTELKELVGDSD
jgi:hypothetical protein